MIVYFMSTVNVLRSMKPAVMITLPLMKPFILKKPQQQTPVYKQISKKKKNNWNINIENSLKMTKRLIELSETHSRPQSQTIIY